MLSEQDGQVVLVKNIGAEQCPALVHRSGYVKNRVNSIIPDDWCRRNIHIDNHWERVDIVCHGWRVQARKEKN